MFILVDVALLFVHMVLNTILLVRGQFIAVDLLLRIGWQRLITGILRQPAFYTNGVSGGWGASSPINGKLPSLTSHPTKMVEPQTAETTSVSLVVDTKVACHPTSHQYATLMSPS